MNARRRLHLRPRDWLLDSQLAPYVDAFTHYLSEHRYAPQTISTYLGCVAHFARWMSRCRLDVHWLDEDVVRQFLDEHLPRCDCIGPVCRTRADLSAALGHLLVVLCASPTSCSAPPPVSISTARAASSARCRCGSPRLSRSAPGCSATRRWARPRPCGPIAMGEP